MCRPAIHAQRDFYALHGLNLSDLTAGGGPAIEKHQDKLVDLSASLPGNRNELALFCNHCPVHGKCRWRSFAGDKHMVGNQDTEHFVQQLAEHQNRMYGYIFSLLGDHNRAADVLQETNVVLWRKVNEFEPEKPFLPWAFAVARFQVLAHVRDQKRDRLLLDAELATTISTEAERQASGLDQVQSALRPCMQTLTASNRELVEKRYLRSMSIADIAAAAGRTVSSVKVALLRSRRHLADCIQLRTAGESR